LSTPGKVWTRGRVGNGEAASMQGRGVSGHASRRGVVRRGTGFDEGGGRRRGFDERGFDARGFDEGRLRRGVGVGVGDVRDRWATSCAIPYGLIEEARAPRKQRGRAAMQEREAGRRCGWCGAAPRSPRGRGRRAVDTRVSRRASSSPVGAARSIYEFSARRASRVQPCDFEWGPVAGIVLRANLGTHGLHLSTHREGGVWPRLRAHRCHPRYRG